MCDVCRENLEQQKRDIKSLQDELNAHKRALEPQVPCVCACVCVVLYPLSPPHTHTHTIGEVTVWTEGGSENCTESSGGNAS